MKKDKKEFVSVLRVIHPTGKIEYFSDGNKIAERNAHHHEYHKILDLRPNPPFQVLSPCQYCGAFSDRGHDPLKHINTLFGEKLNA